MILKSETYHFHRLDLTRQAGFIVTIYDEDGLRLAATMPFSTPAEAFGEARKIVDNKVEGPKKNNFRTAAGIETTRATCACIERLAAQFSLTGINKSQAV